MSAPGRKGSFLVFSLGYCISVGAEMQVIFSPLPRIAVVPCDRKWYNEPHNHFALIDNFAFHRKAGDAMPNEYDNEVFFAQYAQMDRSKGGLAAAGEW